MLLYADEDFTYPVVEELRRQGAAHSGILSATQDPPNHTSMAARIDAALTRGAPGRWHIRVNRPRTP